MKLKDYRDPKYTRLSLYVIFTALLVFLVYHLVAAFPKIWAGIAAGLGFLGKILVPVFWGFLLAYLFDPLCEWIEKKLRKTSLKKTHGLSVALTFLIVLAVVVILLFVIVNAVSSGLHSLSAQSIEQTYASIHSDLEAFLNSLSGWLNSLNVSSESLSGVTQKISGWITDYVKKMASGLGQNVTKATSFVTSLFFSILFSVYFLADGANISHYWGRVFHTLFGKKAGERGKKMLETADRVFSGYIRGQVIDALFMAVTVSIVLSILNVRFSVLIGILTGIGNLIPYVGPVIAYGTTALACLISGEIWKLVISLVVLFILMTIDGQVINPKLLGDNVNIHPMYVVIALLIGGKAAGPLGMLFAVPVAAFVKEMFDELLAWMDARRALKKQKQAE